MSVHELTFAEAACSWLEQGFALLPCQPNSKRLVRGFGPHKQSITADAEANKWWGKAPRSNMAALCSAEHFILDFDDRVLYLQWFEKVGALALTYTEFTPRGGSHAFYRGRPPRGVVLRAGVELKQWCLVAPSVVDGRGYQRGARRILDVDAVPVLSPLSEVGAQSPWLLRTIEITQAAAEARARERGASRVEQIKAQFSILRELQSAVPDFQVFGRGPIVSARCPFHKGGREVNPSMWINAERGLWGCHACGIKGDVINLVAMLRGVSNREAIAYLGARLHD